MSIIEWKMTQHKKEGLKNLDKWKSCFHLKEDPVEDFGEESVATKLNYRPVRLY